MRFLPRPAPLAALTLALILPALTAFAAPVEGTARSSDGVPIRYTVTGEGPVALVFVHGWSCDGSLWSGQVQAFASKYRVVTLDLAGHGRSGRERKEWTIPAFGRDVQAVVEKLDLKRVVLIGHSMGGPVAVAAAGQMPGRVAAVIGIDTMQDIDRDVSPAMIAPFVSQMQGGFPAFTKKFVRAMFPATADTALVTRVAGLMASAPPEIAIPAFQNMFAYDLKAGVAALKAPLREINADTAPINTEGNIKYAKDFDAVIMKGTGHFPHLVQPAEFDRVLGEVLTKVLAQGGRK